MKKPDQPKKRPLSLNRETLKNLTLLNVVGGARPGPTPIQTKADCSNVQSCVKDKYTNCW